MPLAPECRCSVFCNGFQVLCESHLLPGALIRNSQQRFICREQELVVENANTAWTHNFSEGEKILIPLKNGEGNFQASAETVAELEAEGRGNSAIRVPTRTDR